MEKVNALSLRQSLGKVLRGLEKGGQPVQVEKNNRPVAVLVSIRDFRERFADKGALAEREQLVQEIDGFRRKHPVKGGSVLEALRRLRRSE